MSLIRCTFVLAIAGGVSLLGSHAFAASVHPSGRSSPQQADTSTADKAFTPIRAMLDNLATSLANTGGVRPQDHTALHFVRDRAAEFTRQHPGDLRGLAIELQVSIWLGEDELVDDLYGRLSALKPDDTKIILSHAQYAIMRNRFSRAVQILKGATLDPAANSQAFIYLSDALLAEHEFVESVDALRMIPTETLDADPFIKVQVSEKLGQREAYDALWQAEKALREKEAADGDLPLATIKTARGEIHLELFENQAPNTVANFISLAEKNFYDGTKFHRVIPNFMAQGGDPNSRDGATGMPGQGDPGYYIPDEVDRDDARKHFADSLAMAKTAAPNTGGCQFYLTVTPTAHLDNIHTVFGRVVSGLDVVRSLQVDDVIESIVITRKRERDYAPITLPLISDTPALPPVPATGEPQPITIEPVGEAPPVIDPAVADRVDGPGR